MIKKLNGSRNRNSDAVLDCKECGGPENHFFVETPVRIGPRGVKLDLDMFACNSCNNTRQYGLVKSEDQQ